MAKEADPTRCRRHRHSAGVCPFCLRDRLSRLSAAPARAEANANAARATSASLSGSSSPCSYSWEASVAPPAHPPRRRERLGMLLQQEGREAAVHGSAAVPPEVVETEAETAADKRAKRGNFWARLQQQLHHDGWHRKDGCSLAHSRSATEKSAATTVVARPRRAPVV